jgi:hypothetical protein
MLHNYDDMLNPRANTYLNPETGQNLTAKQ